MKKSLLLSALGLIGFSASSQTFVSTTPENRNVVLEEYTGIYCGFCPQGHAIAQDIYDDNPGDVVLVNVHVGGFAAPNAGDPDFRTSFGNALDNAAGVCGYPAGSVNRQEFPGLEQTDNNGNPCGATTAMGRGNWTNAANQVLDDASPVNVAGQATLDLSTRTLTVVVEAYYTGDASNSTNKLTVAVLQNNIAGPQSGSSGNPSQVNPDGTYNHNHMLRHFITGQWGATISTTTQGSFFTDTYEWTVPADINDVPLDLNNLEVAVYVAEGNEDIITGQMAELSVVSPNTYDALPADIEVPEFLCESEVAPKVTIQNMGNETMTSLDIRYNVNGGPIQTYNWTGSLATAATEEVTLPAVSFTHMQENTVWVSTGSPNGQVDEVYGNNDATATFEPAKNSGVNVDIIIVTDNYGSETTWRVRDPNGSVIASGGPYTDGGSQTFTENLTNLSPGCHTFEIDDSFGDGICCAYGQGSFSIESNNATVYTGGEFGSSDERIFNVGGTLGVNDLELVSEVSVYPNPVRDNARVAFNLAENGVVTLDVINVLGATVVSENLGERATGNHVIDLNADRLESGIYMVNLMVGNQIHSTRISVSK